MAFVLGSFQVADYDAWKAQFDGDRVGRTEVATGHQVFQDVDNPNHVFVGIEFPTEADAKAFRERLLASGVLSDGMTVETAPTVVEMKDQTTY